MQLYLAAIIAFLTNLPLHANDHRMGQNTEPPFKRLAADAAGLSTTDFKVTGLSSDADLLLFRKGLTALHGFWTYHAERSFRELIKRNPKHPMPYAFAAYTQVIFNAGVLDRGNRYMADALRLRESPDAVKLTAHENAWIDAIAMMYEPSRGDRKDRQDDHIAALRDLANNPNDYEAKAFLAVALWHWSINPKQDPFYTRDEKAIVSGKEETYSEAEKAKKREIDLAQSEVDNLIKEVHAAYPNHPVHHYKIHLWDYPGQSALALESAKRCGPANPSVAHLWHMSAHTFYGLDQCVNAAWQTEAAQRVDNRYLLDARVHPEQIHNYAHNFDYAMIARIASGGVSDLSELAKGALSAPRIAKDASLAQYAALHAVEGMEAYELWNDYIALYEQNYLKGLFPAPHSADDAKLIGKIERMYVLSLYNKYFQSARDQELWDKAELAFAAWAEKTAITSSDDEAHANLSALFLNVKLSRDIFIAKKDGGLARGEIQRQTINQLIHGDYGFETTSALLALEMGYEDLALTLVAKSEARNGYTGRINPRSALFRSLVAAHVYHETGNFKKADATIAEACTKTNRRLLPADLPMLKRMSWLGDKLTACTPVQGNLDYMQDNNLMALGNLNYRWPNAPEAYLKEFPLGEYKGELVLFTLGANCPSCNSQLNLLPVVEKQLNEAGIRVRVLPATDVAAEDPNARINESWFKAFEVVDEFDGDIIHGVFLIDQKGKMRFHHLSKHAMKDLRFLAEEMKRLIALPDAAVIQAAN